jgi:hypothetical protein
MCAEFLNRSHHNVKLVHSDKGGGMKVMNVGRIAVCHWRKLIFKGNQER